MKELLLEIGTEEIPAGFASQALVDLDALARKDLEAQRIDFAAIRTLGTPRRLVLVVEGLAEKQKDVELRKVGPAKKAAFDAEGRPTRAAAGFAKGQGVPVESLEIVSTEKGEYVCAVRKEAGRPTAELLPSILPGWILALPFRKSMRWADVPVRFARPIHWVVALFGGEVIPFEIGNVRSGKTTFGHRFMAPAPIEVGDFASYLRKTREAFVLVDPEERKAKMRNEMTGIAGSVSGTIPEDPELLNEIAFLVEYPVVLFGSFDRSFLALPQEVPIHSMKGHQRYFPVVDREGKLLPHFVFVSNLISRDPKVVVNGNERVLRARLSDAAYFFREDTKVPLEKRVDQLKGVVFQAKLGTSYEKVMRFRAVASWLCDRIDPGLKAAADRAALLCKADLVTGMVGEFPKLQGIVGREYARLSGETAEVALAIHEHYLPGFAGDRLPSGPVGDIVSMADKIDTITGCFGVGMAPTGTADPFGLRRQALGILRILLEKNYSLSLIGLVGEAAVRLGGKLERPAAEVEKEVLDFLRVRYQNLLLDRGYSFDTVEAAVAVSFDELPDVQGRIDGLKEARASKDFESIVTGFKRAMNILKGNPATKAIAPSLLRDPAEQAFHGAFVTAAAVIEPALERRDYRAVFAEMIRMREPIDTFFDKVMVMVEDERTRQNRLALLDAVGRLFLRVADFSKLS